MTNSNNSKYKDIIILCLILGYIVIIALNIEDVISGIKNFKDTREEQSISILYEETENQDKHINEISNYINDTEEETTAKSTRTVYIAPYGNKYHYKSTCAGKNAISTTFESASKVFAPCQKCTD